MREPVQSTVAHWTPKMETGGVAMSVLLLPDNMCACHHHADIQPFILESAVALQWKEPVERNGVYSGEYN
jgi:hypothetical protein